MCLRIKFCNHQRPRKTKLFKSLYPDEEPSGNSMVSLQDAWVCHDESFILPGWASMVSLRGSRGAFKDSEWELSILVFRMSIFDYENEPPGLQSNSQRVSLPDFRVSHQDSGTQHTSFLKGGRRGEQNFRNYTYLSQGDKTDHFDIEPDISVPNTKEPS